MLLQLEQRRNQLESILLVQTLWKLSWNMLRFAIMHGIVQ